MGAKIFWKPSKPFHVGIHWLALAEYSQMNTHTPGFQSLFSFLRHIVLAKLATTNIRVKQYLSNRDHIHLNLKKMKIQLSSIDKNQKWIIYNCSKMNFVVMNLKMIKQKKHAACMFVCHSVWTVPLIFRNAHSPLLAFQYHQRTKDFNKSIFH